MRCNYRVQNFEEIETGDLIGRVREFKTEGYRMCQICASNVEGGTEVLYSFDKDLELFNIRVTVLPGEKLESITGVYWPAFIYENETHYLFGIEFTDSRLDYGGKFFRLSKPTPWLSKDEGGE